MSTEKAITKAKAKQLDKKALKEILKFDTFKKANPRDFFASEV